MPSLLEALEQKYFNDCQLENFNFNFNNDDKYETTTTSAAEATATTPTTPTKQRKSGNNSKADLRLISIFTPKLPPLQCVPELLVLNDCDIDCAGDFETIRDKCQRVRELDLAQNKLQDWQEVFHILRHMPRIEFLNLSKNRLVGPITNPFCTAPSVSNLRGIVLNGTYLNWLCVDVLLDNLPILEELHLSLNNYREVLIDAAANDKDNELDETIDKDNLNNSDVSTCNHNDLQLNNSNSTNTTTITTTTTEEPTANSEPTTTAINPSILNPDCPTCLALKQCRTIKAHKVLKTLHFTGNPIEHWQEICRLGRVFPSLETLILADCPIKAINLTCENCRENNTPPPPPQITTTTTRSAAASTVTATPATPMTSSTTSSTSSTSEISTNSSYGSGNDVAPYKYFTNLKLLNLSSAKINTWADIDQLAAFPNLTNLRVKNWPLWENIECTEHERRQLLIARLPNVKLLNGGGVISVDEREDAERAFIRYYMEKPEWERPKRYDELIAKHGKLDPLVDINLKPDKRMKIFITFRDKTEPRYVDTYRTVADLKVKLEKILGIPANKMRLFYLDKDYREMGPEIMKYPNKFLYSYNIQPDDEIIVDEKK